MVPLPDFLILMTPYGQPSQSPYQQPSYPPPMPPMPGRQLPGAEKRMQAALLAIFLGGFGAHKFLLGYQQEGLIMAAGTIGGFILAIIIGLVTCGVGFILFIIPFAVSVIGLIEGVLYLNKSDEEFVRTYVQGRRPWF